MALLSAGEVLALDGSTIRLALWPGSRTTANLTRTGRAALTLVWVGSAYTLRLETCRAPDLSAPETRAVFDGQLASVRRDEVPYATLESGVTFALPDRAAVVSRWRATIDALRAHPRCEAA